MPPVAEMPPPAKYNYMPHAPAIGAEGVDATQDLGLLGRRDLRGLIAAGREGR